MEDYFQNLIKALHAESKDSTSLCDSVEQQSSLKRKVRQRQITQAGVTIKTHSPNHTAFNHKDSISDRTNLSRLSILWDIWDQRPLINWVLAAAVVILLIFNGILCYKLYFADDLPYVLDLHVLK